MKACAKNSSLRIHPRVSGDGHALCLLLFQHIRKWLHHVDHSLHRRPGSPSPLHHTGTLALSHRRLTRWCYLQHHTFSCPISHRPIRGHFQARRIAGRYRLEVDADMKLSSTPFTVVNRLSSSSRSRAPPFPYAAMRELLAKRFLLVGSADSSCAACLKL